MGLFLNNTPSEQIFITDFTLHSIGIVMSKLNRTEGLLQFVKDVFVDSAAVLIHLEPDDFPHIVQVIKQYRLDFDDAYQYVAAEKYNLILISFDSDFDRTQLKRKRPAEILKVA